MSFNLTAVFKEPRNAEQWSINEDRIRFTPTIAREIRLAPISSPATLSTFLVHNFPKRSPYLSWPRDNDQWRLSAKAVPPATLCNLKWTAFSQTSLVNARVSLVPCNWYNVKKQFGDRPEKTYGPCLWSGVSLVHSWRRAAASCY